MIWGRRGGVYIAAVVLRGRSGRGGRGGQGRKGCGQWSGRADGRKRRGRGLGGADGRMGRQAVGRTGGRGADGAQEARTSGRADWAVGADGARTAGQADGRTGGLGRMCVLAVRRLGGLADGRTGGRAGGPGFKRPHSTRPTSLLGAQSACLIKARARRVLGSAVGSSMTPRQTPVLSARTRLPRLSASVLGAEKGHLLFKKNGFTDGRWQRDAKSTASTSCTKGRGWRRGQEKAKSGGHGARRVPQPGPSCIPGMGATVAAMVSSHGHEVCRIPPLRPLVATYFTRTALQIEGCKILAS